MWGGNVNELLKAKPSTSAAKVKQQHPPHHVKKQPPLKKQLNGLKASALLIIKNKKYKKHYSYRFQSLSANYTD